MKLDRHAAIVTGASGGIGLATARRLLREGASVTLVGRHRDKLDEARSRLLADAPAERILVAACDVAQEDEVKAAVRATQEAFGRWDIVVNNAGVMRFKPIEEQDAADWRATLDVDLLGAFFFVKQAFLRMGRGGAVVNVASVHAIATEALVAPYAAAKAALLSFTRSAAIEGRAKGIRVNAVVPGAIDTPMLWDNPNVKSGAEQVDPADVGAPEDIAATVAFLAGPDAAFVNGAALLADGGRLARL
jgi:NAD(P)-dependent dehydrogenase (short-subunit alcohol dehydrogenase family)